MKAKNPNSEARRRLLEEWIRTHYDGNQAAFIEDARRRGHKVNQGELSNILSGKKGFGEIKAETYETQGNMPKGTLTPNKSSAAAAKGVPSTEIQRDFDIIALQAVIQSMITSMVENIPASASPFVSHLDQQIDEIKKKMPYFSDSKGIVASARSIAAPNRQRGAASGR